MNSRVSFSGTLRHVRAHWPGYLLLYGGGALLSLLVILLAARTRLWGIVLLALSALLVLIYFLAASLWAAHEMRDRRQNHPAQVLFKLGSIDRTDDFVHVGLGLRDVPVNLSRRLTRGRIRAVDVYNPQLAPSRTLAREREVVPASPPDPRLTWLEGSIDLLPLPDNGTPIVTISHTLHELWQDGDRRLLLQEVYRILKPGGSLLLAEPARTTLAYLVWGPGALRLEPPLYWRTLLQECGFRVSTEESVQDLFYCYRALKPLPGEVQQLTLDFGI